MTTEPDFLPVASDSIPWETWEDVPRFRTRWRHLSRAVLGPTYQVGVAIEELDPGCRTAPVHWHAREEEHVYVLGGTVTLHLGGRAHTMRPGDYVCFPAGQRAGHCLENKGDAPCRYVIIGERLPDETVVYPETGKVYVHALGEGVLLDTAARRGYWDGEVTGLPPGETPPRTVPVIPPDDEPLAPIAEASVEWHDEGPGEGTRFGGRSRHLTSKAVGRDYRVGVLIEAPAPGRRLCPLHYHTAEEEHALVLEGRLTLLLGEERHAMGPGDYVAFPAGRRVGHSFLNSGDAPCRYLMIGQSNAHDVCVYPDSSRLFVRALDEGFAMHRRDYWGGEDLG